MARKMMKNNSALIIPVVLLCLMPLINCKIDENRNNFDAYNTNRAKQDLAINQNPENNDREYGDVSDLSENTHPIVEHQRADDVEGPSKHYISNDEHKKLFAGYRESYITKEAANRFRQRIREHKKPYTDRDYDDLLHDITVKPKRIIYDKKYFDYLPTEEDETTANSDSSSDKSEDSDAVVGGLGMGLVLDNNNNKNKNKHNNYNDKDMDMDKDKSRNKNENHNEFTETQNSRNNMNHFEPEGHLPQYHHYPGSRVNSRRFKRAAESAKVQGTAEEKEKANTMREKRQGNIFVPPMCVHSLNPPMNSFTDNYHHQHHHHQSLHQRHYQGPFASHQPQHQQPFHPHPHHQPPFQQHASTQFAIEPQRFYELTQTQIAPQFNANPWYNHVPASLSYPGNYYHSAPLPQSPSPAQSQFFYSPSFPLYPEGQRPSNFYLPIPVNYPNLPVYTPTQLPGSNRFPIFNPNFPAQNPNSIYPTDKPANNNNNNNAPVDVPIDNRFSFVEKENENDQKFYYDPVYGQELPVGVRPGFQVRPIRPVRPPSPISSTNNFLTNEVIQTATRRPLPPVPAPTRRPSPVVPLKTSTAPPLVINSEDDYDWDGMDEPVDETQNNSVVSGGKTITTSTPPPLVHNSDDYDWDSPSRSQTKVNLGSTTRTPNRDVSTRTPATESLPSPTVATNSNTLSVNSDTSRCVWAIVNCCSRANSRIRYSCFEQIGCTGAFWDLNPCSNNVLDAAINAADQYYNNKK